MQIVGVSRRTAENEFINLPASLYRNDPEWPNSAVLDVQKTFDPQKNSFFKHGCCTRWILQDSSQRTIGRIAAFINYEKLNGAQLPAGGIGFFECIADKNAACELFTTAKNWLCERQMKAMDGPINFGENFNYWGLLVEGFKRPAFGMNYNFSYYQELFEQYGFVKLYDQYTNLIDATVPMPERFTQIANRVMGNPKFQFRHIAKRSFEKFARDMQEIYNDAWSDFEDFTPLQMERIMSSFKEMKPIIDERIIWFAYYNEEPVAFIVCLPEINKIFNRLDGSFNWVNKLKFLWYLNTIPIDRLRIIIMGCKKKFQNRGIESALIRCLQLEVLPRKTITEVELSWVGDFNPKMIALHHATGAKRDKVHRTYRYTF